nr:double-strand break repair protein AddB [Caulobacter sp. CCUG 60055]
MFGRPPPRWFTIPAHRPFVEDLALGLHQALTPLGPDALSDAVVLTPTRRGARTLAEAFVKAAGGQAMLLPQIRAVGDLDEGEPPFEPGDLALDLPPAVSVHRRRFELARLVAVNAPLFDRRLDAAAALELADALAGFLDSVEIEEIADPGRVEGLVEGELARHWLRSAEVLKLALEAWPRRLEEMGLVDVSRRRVALLRALAEKWRLDPPKGVLVAAGSTGTAPATARLLGVVARAPLGAVVLPGLDQNLAESAWEQVGEQHPQGAMKRLLDREGAPRDAVASWLPDAEAEPRGRWRRRLINEALRPAEATADWRAQIDGLRREGAAEGVDPIAEGLDGLSVVAARTEEEAAAVAALMLREVLETPGKTGALVTPDQVLARRVAARLARWGVGADSSAGAPLIGFPVGVLANLVARAAAEPLDPVRLLAILKHPFVRLGRDEADLARAREALERYALRGPRPADWAAIADRLDRRRAPNREGEAPGPDRLAGLDAARALADDLAAAIDLAASAWGGGLAPPPAAARALVGALERLAADPGGDPGGLWAGPAGEAAGALLAALIGEGDGLPAAAAEDFADLLEALVSGETVRTGGATHPRIRILGAIEARLVRADRLIVAGLEEGVWPKAPPIDPFLSRPMRARLGLPPPERRVGLAAHDFAQAACAPEVVLLHAERRGDAPAVKSRWLWRLETLARGADLALPERPEVLAWARALDAADAFRPAPRPRPRPPVEARPRELPVTGVEQWVRDPYATYARRILRLRPLDRPDAPVEAMARGTAIHAAFERFAKEHATLSGDGDAAAFEAILIDSLIAAGMPMARMTRERALAANAAPWAAGFERRRRDGARLLIEQEGALTFAAPGGPFTVTAKADRIELRGAVADVLDFKTGMPPSQPQIESGLAPQLTLTAAILQGGGFAEAGRATPGDLIYVRVSGGRKPGEEIVRAAAGESADLAARALEGLQARAAFFDDPSTPYVSWATPQFIDRYGGDYDHLARLWEWHVIGEGDAGEGGE